MDGVARWREAGSGRGEAEAAGSGRTAPDPGGAGGGDGREALKGTCTERRRQLESEATASVAGVREARRPVMGRVAARGY